MKVVALYRYPVKAMAAEPLEAAELGWWGVAGDREHAFVRSGDRSDFPWLTIRQVPNLTRYQPLADGLIRAPDGREVPLESLELAAELAAAHGAPVHLLRSFRGLHDSSPVSLISLQTVRALSELAGRPLEPLRFRPNIVVDAPEAYAEEELVGRAVEIGKARVRVDRRDKRCMVVNFDHRTAGRDPAVLRTVAQQRDTRLGVYGSVERPGTIRVGDRLE
jgi:uncharacterized protein YcbX